MNRWLAHWTSSAGSRLRDLLVQFLVEPAVVVALAQRKQFPVEIAGLGILQMLDGEAGIVLAVGPVGQVLEAVHVGALRAEDHAHRELDGVLDLPAAILRLGLLEHQLPHLFGVLTLQLLHVERDIELRPGPLGKPAHREILAKELQQRASSPSCPPARPPPRPVAPRSPRARGS